MSEETPEEKTLREAWRVMRSEVDGASIMRGTMDWDRRAAEVEAAAKALGAAEEQKRHLESDGVTAFELMKARASRDEVYRERDQCIGLIARLALCYGLRVGLGRHPDGDGWEHDWMTIVFIDLPSGQISWHIHDSEVWMFQALPPYTAPWDGHDTDLKYRRVVSCALGPKEGPNDDAAIAEVQRLIGIGRIGTNRPWISPEPWHDDQGYRVLDATQDNCLAETKHFDTCPGDNALMAAAPMLARSLLQRMIAYDRLYKAATVIVDTRLADGVGALYALIANLADVIGRPEIASSLRQEKDG